MANKNEQETRTSIDELNDSLTSVTAKVEANKKPIMWAVIAVVSVIVAVLFYVSAFRTPAIEKGDNMIGEADLQMFLGNDSVALAQYQKVASDNSYDAGNRAALQSAIILYQKGDYQGALKSIEEFDGNGSIIETTALSLKGDCYVNLDENDEAIKCYDSAISSADGNAFIAPFFMMKKATVLHATGKHAEEAAIYESIQKDYPQYVDTYMRSSGNDIQRYIERAKAEAGK